MTKEDTRAMSYFAALVVLATASNTPFHELKCSGVPVYPRGKRVVLEKGQVWESAVSPGMFSIVEFEGMVGLIHYDVRRTNRRTLRGTATHVKTSNWHRQSAPIECEVLR